MLDPKSNAEMPEIPGKRYFTIGEVSELCTIKPHVLRYWEQEFPQLKPVKRRGNRRYYQRHEVQLILKIKELLYSQGFTISGARTQLSAKVATVEKPIGGVAIAKSTIKDDENITSKQLSHLIKDLAEVADLLRV